MSGGQRVAIVVTWAAVLVLVGMYVASNWSIFGTVSTVALPSRVARYAPLQAAQSFPSRFGLTALECFFVWIGLVGAWLAGALLLLAPRTGAPATAPAVLPLP